MYVDWLRKNSVKHFLSLSVSFVYEIVQHVWSTCTYSQGYEVQW